MNFPLLLHFIKARGNILNKVYIGFFTDYFIRIVEAFNVRIQ